MVKKVILYHCGICDTAYPSKREAAACEALGQPNTSAHVGDRIGQWDNVTVEGTQVILVNRPGGRYHEVEYTLSSPVEGRFTRMGDSLHLL